MSKLIYYVAATMDGYIATKNHELGWLEAFTLSDDATPYDIFYQGIGSAIIGAGTYEWIMENTAGHWPYQNIPCFILSSRNLSIPANINAVVVQCSVEKTAVEKTVVQQIAEDDFATKQIATKQIATKQVATKYIAAKQIAAKAKTAAKGKNVWVIGGGETAAFFADAGELQQLFITTVPVFLGSGIRVLPVNHLVQAVPQTQRFLSNGAVETIMDIKPMT
ncbi:MAG: dihydrofolate reductase family protein [Enterobacteriaceae bacterium]|nr:dihydrofolate reductase family protein [Enterobacteriaceae bacterium]